MTKFVLGFCVGFAFTYIFVTSFSKHPYDICQVKYDKLEDIDECIWLLTQQK